jgi:hypothetical protein
MNQSSNPPIEPTAPNQNSAAELHAKLAQAHNQFDSDLLPTQSGNPSEKVNILNTSNKIQNNMSSREVLDKVVKLALRKSATHQFKNDELQKCGVTPENCDSVREAISKADAFRNNAFFAFVSGLFSQIGGFFDSIFKVVLIMAIFLLSLQVPYINSNKYEITVEQFSEILKKYKINPADAKKEIPAQVKEDKEKSQRWMKYKDSTVESLAKEAIKSPAESKEKIDDLKLIYQKTFKAYKPGLPDSALAYRDAAFVSVIVLVLFILLQSLFGILVKGFFRSSSLRAELRKVL